MRKISCYLLLGLLGALFYGCKQDQIVSPATPSFTVDNQSPFVGGNSGYFYGKSGEQCTIHYLVSLWSRGRWLCSSRSINRSFQVARKRKGLQVGFVYGKNRYFPGCCRVKRSFNATGTTIKNSTSSAITMTALAAIRAALTSFGLLLNPTKPADSTTVLGVSSFLKQETALTLVLPYGNGSSQTNLASGVKRRLHRQSVHYYRNDTIN